MDWFQLWPADALGQSDVTHILQAVSALIDSAIVDWFQLWPADALGERYNVSSLMYHLLAL